MSYKKIFARNKKEFVYLRISNKQKVEIMKSLVEQLQAETQSFKQVYLNRIKKWSVLEFDAMVERTKWNDEKWCEFLGLEPRVEIDRWNEKTRVTFPKNFFNTKKAGTYDRALNTANVIVAKGFEKFRELEVKKAEIHFQNSLEKLAFRIQKKELDESKLKVVSAHVDVNLTITITDGTKVVRAFTIIASGEVQKPHYRYLIK